MRRNPFEKRLKWKILALVLSVILLIVLIVVTQYQGAKEREAYERRLKEQEQELEELKGTQEENTSGQEGEQPQAVDGSGESAAPGDANDMSGLWQEAADRAGLNAASVSITNLAEYASPSMGGDAGLLEQRLSGWATEKKNAAVTASIIHVMVPESDPQSVHYYVRMDDGDGTLVLLAYHPRENVVTASDCSYTEEEVMAEAWEGCGPVERDVPEEADAAFQQQQEDQQVSEQGEQPDSLPQMTSEETGGE